MSNIGRRVVAIGSLTAVACFIATGAARADLTVTAVGWWTSSAAPPTVPQGGIAVSNDPSGSSVGALRLDVGGGASSATLKLVETANQVDKLGSMQVCAAQDTWRAASGGTASDAPADSCSAGSVLLTQQTDGSWTADLHQLLAGKTGSASVIVKPAPGAGPFQIAFEPPLVAGATADSSSGGSAGSASSAPAPSDSTSSAATAPSPSAVLAPSYAQSAAAPTPAAAPSGDSTTPTTATAPASATSGAFHQFKANVTAGVASGHRTTRGSALGIFAVALLLGAGAAGASWAKAQGLLDIAGLRARFLP